MDGVGALQRVSLRFARPNVRHPWLTSRGRHVILTPAAPANGAAVQHPHCRWRACRSPPNAKIAGADDSLEDSASDGAAVVIDSEARLRLRDD